MNRHERRTMESVNRRFRDGLVSDVKPYEPHETEVLTKFFNHITELKKENKYPVRVFGAFGEWEGADGFVEEVIEPPEGGRLLKLWGNSFLLKGPHDGKILHTFDLAKSLISELPREFIGGNFILTCAFGFMALFQKKRFIYLCDSVMNTIMRRTVRWIEIPEKDFNKQTRELRRAALWVIHEQYGLEYPADVLDLKEAWEVKYAQNEFGHLLLRLVRFVVLFLEIDTAYMFRVQDAFGELSERGIDAFWKGLDRLISREVAFKGVGQKWRFIKIVLKLGMWRYPELKRFLDAFFTELDYEKVKMTDDDKYFSLAYVSYDFGGKPQAERFAERERIDKERKHVFIKK